MALGSVWVFADLSQGRVTTGTLELLTKARSLGARTVEAVCFGPEAVDAVAELGRYGATTLHLSQDPAFAELLFGGPAADTLAALVVEHRPDLILFAATHAGRDVAGRLAARLDVPVIANGLEIEAGDAITVTTAIFGATQIVRTEFGARRPALALFRPKSFAAAEAPDTAPIREAKTRAARKSRFSWRRIACI